MTVGIMLHEKQLKRKDVCELVGVSRYTLYHLITKQSFPKPIKLNGRVMYWLEREVQAWIQARVQNR